MKTIITSAKTIIKTAKLVPFSGIHTLIGIKSGEGNIFYFPQPDIVFKKDQTEAENMERTKALFYQLFNYDTHTNNLYFIRLEISSLIQEIKLAIDSLTSPVKVSFEKIYKEVLEIENKGGFYKKTDYWNRHIEGLKNDINTLIEKLNVENSGLFNVYLAQTVERYKSERNTFKNLLNSIYTRRKLSVLENSFIKHANYITGILNREQWQKDAYKFYNIYNSMEENERREFLNALSITENEIASVRKMTKEQWKAFLNNILPAVYLFVTNYVNKDNYIEILENNKILKNISSLNQEQWLDFKIKLFNNKNSNFERLISFFKTEQNKVLHENWKAEQRNFINFVYDNKYISELSDAVSVVLADYTEFKMWNDEFFNVHNIKINDVSSKFSDWLSYLTESQWEEVKTVLKANENNQYIRPLLEILKEPKMEGQEPEFSAEKRRFINYINENKKATLEVIGTLENKEEIKKELEKCVSLKDVHALLRNEEKKEIIKSDSSSISLENEDLKWEKTENNVSLEIEDWLSYLTESQWEEVKTVLKANENNQYIRPLLEILKLPSQEKNEPEFSAEKRRFINYINENKKASLEIIETLENKNEIKEELEKWVNLKDVHTLLRNEEKKEIIKSDSSSISLENEDLKWEKTENNVSLEIEDWLSYLTESQWEEVKTVLKANENNQYIRPLLEILKLPSQEKNEPEFSAEKRRFINYINENKKASLEIIETLENKNEIKEELEKWVDLEDVHTLLRNEEKKEIIKNDFSSISLENEDLKWEKTENNVPLEIEDWLSYLTESQWEEMKSVLKDNEDKEYVNPVLEILSGTDFKDAEKLRLFQKEKFIKYINDNKSLADKFMKIVSQNKVLYKSINNWVNKDVNKFDIKKEQINKHSNQVNRNYGFSKLQNLRFSNKTKRFINDWISDIEMREYQYLEKAPAVKTYNVDSHFKNINIWFKQKKYSNEIWQRTRTLDNSGTILKNNNLMYKKNYRGWNNMINYSLLNSFENGNNSHIGAVFETYKSGTFTNIESKDINKFSSFNNSLRNTWNFYRHLEKVYGYADNNESSKYINFGYMHFNYKEPLASFSGRKDFQDIYNEKFLNGAYKNYSADAFNINRSSIFGNINKMTLNKGNYDMMANKISYLLTGNHNKTAENEFSQYKIADLVVVKKDYGHTAIDNTPKMPEIQNEVKKAVNSQINDIITVKHNETEERNGNKEVYELTKRLNLQQKEIEKILTSQKQMLKITDISIVTEKIMNQMQSQLRLEKLRRGL